MKHETQVIFLAGSEGLLGKALANQIEQKGWIAVRADIVNKNNFEIGNKKITAYIDINNELSIDELIKQVINKYQKIDAFVNCAYPRNANFGRKLDDVEHRDFNENICLQLGGAFLLTKKFTNYFLEQGYGNIINTGSVYGIVPPRFEIYDNCENMSMPIEYAAVKSGLIHLTKYFSKYYKNTKIRFNCISPGGIYNNHSEIFVKQYGAYAKSGGMLDVEKVVNAFIFLLSNSSTGIEGQNIVVDEGFI